MIKKNVFFFKSVIFVLLLLLSLSLAYGASQEKEIVEGERITVSDGGSLSLYDSSYLFRLSTEEDKIYISKQGSDPNNLEDLFVSNGKCGDMDLVSFCFDGSTGETIYVKLYALIPELELEQSLDNLDIFLGLENQLNVTITNTGEKDAKGVRYELPIPDEIEIVSATDGAFVKGNKVLWNGTIASEESIDFFVKFKPKVVYHNLVLTSKVTYNNLFVVSSFEDEIEHDSREWLQIGYFLDESEEHGVVKLGNPTMLNIELFNNHTTSSTNILTGNNLSIKSLRIYNQDDFTRTDQKGFELETPNYVVWSGKLQFNQSKILKLEVVPLHEGLITIPVEIEYYETDINDTYTIIRDLVLDVSAPKIELYPSISPGLEVNSSAKTFFDITVKNTDNTLDLNDVLVVVQNENGISQWPIDTLRTNSQKTLNDFSFTASSSSEMVEKSFDITVTYTTEQFSEGKYKESFSYYVVPYDELEITHNVSILGDDEFAIEIYAKNKGGLVAKSLSVDEIIPEYTFIKGKPTGSLDELKSGHSDVLARYEIATPDINLSESHVLTSTYQYTISNVTKVFTKDFDLGAMLLPLAKPKQNIFQKTKKNIESIFTSMHFFSLFILSIVLLIGAVVIFIHNKHEFSVQGVSNIKSKQLLINQRRKAVNLRARSLAPAIQATTRMIGEMKERLTSTKDEMKKRLPVFDEKRSGLQIRQDEIMRENLALDEKIKELQDIKNKLMMRHKGYETEKHQIDTQEGVLKQRFEKTKAMIGNLTSKFKGELEQEHQLNIKRDKLNRTELNLLAKKQKLVETGRETMSSEKMTVLQEKVRLEHERNKVQEELFSLANRRKDIESAQTSLQKEHANVQKEQNVFDANKKALASTLLSLQSQSESLNKILEDSSHSEIAKLSEDDD